MFSWENEVQTTSRKGDQIIHFQEEKASWVFVLMKWWKYDLNRFIVNRLKDSITVLHPVVFWYLWNGMGAQKNSPKKVFVTLFLCMLHVKTKWNIVYEYLKTKIFSRDTNILPQMHWTSNIFGHSATTIWGFCVSLNYPILDFKKTVCPGNV